MKKIEKESDWLSRENRCSAKVNPPSVRRFLLFDESELFIEIQVVLESKYEGSN